MKSLVHAIASLAVLSWAGTAAAIPRFAARTGMECIECHVSPGGAGVRNSYGRNVFEQAWLPLRLGAAPSTTYPADLSDEDVERLAATVVEGADTEQPPFSGDVSDWLAVGGDVRASYFWIRPDRGATPTTPRDITSTFFLMESYFYVHGKLHPNVDVVLQLGPYAGFEAWGLFRLLDEQSPWNLSIKVGRFMPAFGIREVEHQLYTRELVGFGNADRDTGIELTLSAGPMTAQVGVYNGTLGDVSLDTHGSERRTFEKAAVGRVALRHDFGWLRGQVGLSAYFSEDSSQPTPLIAQIVPRSLSSEPDAGVNDLRLGGFLTANLGRFTYLGDFVFVKNYFYSQDLPAISAYASYQELAFAVTQGIDAIAMLEFMDPNVQIADNQFVRAGLAVEVYPLPFTEIRAMVRRVWTDVPATGGSWDFVLFAHLFM